MIGQSLHHVKYGKGIIKEILENHVMIEFENGIKSFQYPEAFKTFLVMDDPTLQTKIEDLGKQKEIKEILLQEERAKKSEEEWLNHIHSVKVANRKKQLMKHPLVNIAFKCNECDGGKTPERIGFYGVCSDDLIHQNILMENRAHCNEATCPCNQYLQNKMTREELETFYKENHEICNESMMLQDWRVFAGVYRNGKNAGKPMHMEKAQPDCLAILTTKELSQKEEEREIFAVFLIDECFTGDKTQEGFVACNSEYKIELKPHEAHEMKFWNYYINETSPEKFLFSSGVHRYVNHQQAAQILRDIASIKKGTTEENLANRFYHQFCSLHDVEEATLALPSGTLTRKKMPTGAK